MNLKSPRSVDQYTSELVDVGALRVTPRVSKNRQTTNEYVVLSKPVRGRRAPVNRGAESCTPGGAESCTPGGAESCSRTKNQQDLRTSRNTPPTPSAEVAIVAPAAPAEFDQWYEVYPKKAKRPAAERAFAKARKDASFEELMVGARRWAEAGIEKQFIPYPATWLNNRQWEDEPPTRRPRPSWQMDNNERMAAAYRQGTRQTEQDRHLALAAQGWMQEDEQ